MRSVTADAVYLFAIATLIVGFAGKTIARLATQIQEARALNRRRARLYEIRRTLNDEIRSDRLLEDACWQLHRTPLHERARWLMADRHSRNMDELVDDVSRNLRLVTDVAPKLEVVG